MRSISLFFYEEAVQCQVPTPLFPINGVRRTNDFIEGRIPLTEELNMPQLTDSG